MRYIIVSIKDRSVNAFQPPYTARTEAEAIRGFKDAIATPANGPLHTTPEDFDLYWICHFDDQSGTVEDEGDVKQPFKIADGKTIASALHK